jgi:hypothetical protein
MGLGDDEFPDVLPLTNAKPPTISKFSIDLTNSFTIPYYANGMNNYANAAIRIHSMIKKGEYKV